MKVKCRLCGELLTLAKDSVEARGSGADPHQQLRRHLNDRHTVGEITSHAARCGWLVDVLAFSSEDPAYREAAIRLLNYYLALH